jgi:hypothetical protein
LEIWSGDEHALGLNASLSRETTQLGRRRLTLRLPGGITAHCPTTCGRYSGPARPPLHPLGFVRGERRLCVVRMTDKPPPAARRGVKSRRGKPSGRARTSGGFARRANVNDHETARSCCEPSRRLDAVERRWSWHNFASVYRAQAELPIGQVEAREMRSLLRPCSGTSGACPTYFWHRQTGTPRCLERPESAGLR